MANIPTALYLQGGPGLNCAVERVWFGEKHSVLWWDQPRFPAEKENAYQATLDAAAEKLAELHRHHGKPLDVIGWSFGARLALDLAHRTREAIGSLTLLAPSLCLETAFAHLATNLAARGARISLPRSPHTGNHEDFMQRVMSILAIPELFSYYWAPASTALFQRHYADTAGSDWFDLDTFTAISREVIRRPITALATDHTVRILAGRHDPYFDPETDIVLWKRIFPQASVRIVDSGHMLPLEIPTVEWIGSPTCAS